MTQQQDAWDLPVASGQIVTDVEGDLTSAKLAPAIQPGGNQLLKLGLTGIKVHKSLSAYPHAQFEIDVPYAMKGAKWIALTDSLKEQIGDGMTFQECKGMRIRFEWSLNIKGRIPDPEVPGNWIEGQIEGWVVKSVEGSKPASTPVTEDEPVDFDEVLIELATGRAEGDFVQEALKDTRVKANPEFLDQIFQQNAGVLSDLIAAGRLEIDGDIFRVPNSE